MLRGRLEDDALPLTITGGRNECHPVSQAAARGGEGGAFGKVLQASPDQRGALWDELKPELEAHEQLEDACLYEPLSREAGPKDAKLTAWRQQHQGEVTKVESLIKSLEGLLAEDARWLNKVQEIHASLLSHIREEESNIFPSVVTVWDDSRLRQAGMEMEKMKARKARRAA